MSETSDRFYVRLLADELRVGLPFDIGFAVYELLPSGPRLVGLFLSEQAADRVRAALAKFEDRA